MNIDTGDIWFQKFETVKTIFKFLKSNVASFINRKSNKPFIVAEILPVGLERLRT